MSLSSARRRVAPALLVVALAAGCSGTEEEPAPDPPPEGVAEIDPAEMALPRIDFCELVPEESVADALGGTPRSSAGRATDLDVQETGCTWRAGGTVARAWIFARPVGERLATRTAEQAADREGCDAEVDDAFGRPSVHQVCRLGDDRVRDRRAGLFGDTWLTCELAGPAEVLAPRADAWCAQVAEALDTAG